jgi:hypothetical protein
MNDPHEVISAFLDDEPFDPRALTDALSSPAGRDLLIDLMALRHLTQMNGNGTPALTMQQPRRSSLRALAAVAAVLVALAGGYLVGQRRGEAEMFVAPPATRVVQAPAVWQDVPAGRMP